MALFQPVMTRSYAVQGVAGKRGFKWPFCLGSLQPYVSRKSLPECSSSNGPVPLHPTTYPILRVEK